MDESSPEQSSSDVSSDQEMVSSDSDNMVITPNGTTYHSYNVPCAKLSNELQIPKIGLATWKAAPREIGNIVKYAISIGYRYIDCAFAYRNEKEVGDAINIKISDGTVSRENLFLASKLWNTYHRREQVEVCCSKSLHYLGVTYLDLYVIHWPIAFVFKDGEYFPRYENGIMITEDIDFTETWKGMEDLYDKGLVKSIGLANFNISQIEKILKMCRIRPCVLQVECHPYFNQMEIVNFCQKEGILVTAYTPLGQPDRPWIKKIEPNIYDDARIKSMCQKYNKTPAEIALRFNVQRNIIVIPASVIKHDVEKFLQVFDFELTEEEMTILFNSPQVRFYCYDRAINDVNYPFQERVLESDEL